MYRYIDPDGTEHQLPDVAAFVRAVRHGEVDDDTLVYSDEFDRWQPAANMDLYEFAANTHPPADGGEPSGPAPAPAPEDGPTPHDPTTTATVLKCRTCETDVLPSDRFCPGCSTSLTSDIDVFRAAAEPRTAGHTTPAADVDKPAWGPLSPLLPRATRRNYFFWTVLAALDLAVLEASTSQDAILVFGLLALLLGAVQIVAGVGRLHDTGNSGWWTLLALIPIANIGLGIYLLFAGPIDGDNEYGPDPRRVP